MFFMLVTLDVSHLEISGKNDKEPQLLNMDSIFVTFTVFHLDISGKDI